ncbi:hypothetical protein VTJ49DRAFT_1607 [Mycothermus thermophilus]|uniref:Uncharacterized protein n=1 Tax=Humicola insolens TaxID=85995 RepID=A0ABR3VCY0_HUMIN
MANEIITIINNSGKVISTGKQLVGIFKEAQAAYRDRRDAVKAERAAVKRSKTFDVAPRRHHYDDEDYGQDRRMSYDEDDTRSRASSRLSRSSRRSRRPRSSERPLPALPEGDSSARAPLALTEGNLKAHSEVSTTTPSKVSRSPYSETAPRDMQLSGPPPPASETAPAPSSGALVRAPGPDMRQPLIHRSKTEPIVTRKKSIDLNLAYGDIPPDLESRADLDVGRTASPEPEDPQTAEALNLMERIETFLEEAQCMHDTATHMIDSLQRNPEAAAAVALSLAELSALLGKMSPAFLGFLKGGSPAVFALLASPQFLIGASVVAGVTVVIFGGLKIIKRIAAGKTLEAPMEMRAVPAGAPAGPTANPDKALPAVPADDTSVNYDEALVLRDVEELSTIESWRRGIPAFAMTDESADIEAIRREAELALKECFQDDLDEVAPCDSVSQVSWARPDRSRRGPRSSYSHRSHRSHRDRDRDRESEFDIPERKSSRREKDDGDGARSEASHRSHRSSSSKSHHESRSTVSRSSRHSTRLKAIEEGRGEGDDARSTASSSASRRSRGDDARSTASGSPSGRPKEKEKKRELIKQLFKMKKDKEEHEKAVSVMA